MASRSDLCYQSLPMKIRTMTLALAASLALSGCAWRQAVAEAEAARALAADGKVDEARAKYKSALAMDPDIVGVHHGLGLLALQTGDLPGAIAELMLELNAHPDNDDARFNLAVAELRLGRPDQALAQLDAMAGDATADRTLLRALVLLRKGDLPGARAATEQITEETAFSAYLRGLLAAAGGHPQDAVAPLEQAIRLDPKWPAPYLALGVVRARSGAAREGATEVLPAIKLDPKDVDGPLLAGILMLRAGNATGATDQLQAALAMDLERAGTRNALAVARSLTGDARSAAELLEEEIAKHPALAVAHRNRAILLFRSGDLEGARMAFDRAIKLDPTDASSRKAVEALDQVLPAPAP